MSWKLQLVFALLLLVLLGLQYRLWVGEGSLAEVSTLRQQLAAQRVELKDLQERNATLRAEVDDLVSNLNLLEANAEQRWLMVGGGLVLIGLALGFATKSRPRRSAWN